MGDKISPYMEAASAQAGTQKKIRYLRKEEDDIAVVFSVHICMQSLGEKPVSGCTQHAAQLLALEF